MEKILSIVETVSLYLVGFSIFGVFVCTGLELGNGAAELALVGPSKKRPRKDGVEVVDVEESDEDSVENSVENSAENSDKERKRDLTEEQISWFYKALSTPVFFG